MTGNSMISKLLIWLSVGGLLALAWTDKGVPGWMLTALLFATVTWALSLEFVLRK